jgi:uncharacterized protein
MPDRQGVMPESGPRLATFSPDGREISWSTWDGGHSETLNLTWDNEAWTAVGKVGRERVEYVLRLAPTWHVRQFLLFRDLEEPDLWLAIDAKHRWGEVNGSYRRELDGCADIELACTPFTATIPIRRLRLAVGDVADIDVIDVDVETLATNRQPVRYERLGAATYRRTAPSTGDVREFEVDEFGLVVDEPERFRRSRD